MYDYMIKGKWNLKLWVLIIVKGIWIMKCAMFEKIGLEVCAGLWVLFRFILSF